MNRKPKKQPTPPKARRAKWYDEKRASAGDSIRHTLQTLARQRESQGEFAGTWATPQDPFPRPGVYAMTRAEWDNCRDPVRLVKALPDVDPRQLVKPGREWVRPRRYRLLAAELFRHLAHDGTHGSRSVAGEFADILLRSDWLDLPLAPDWASQTRNPHPDPRVRHLLSWVRVGPMTRRQTAMADDFLRGGRRPNQPYAAFRPASPCNRDGVADMLSAGLRTIRSDDVEYQLGSWRGYSLYEDFPETGCRLVRESFRGPGPYPPFRREWLTDTVLALRRSMLDPAQLGAAPILADALQDAGCDQEDVLTHLRGPGPHTVGCWALDIIED